MDEAVSAPEARRPVGPVPGETEIVLLSFEGPDRYARRGVLGDYTTGMSRACAGAGFSTTLVFVGDPDAPHEEVTPAASGGALRLVRWSQWISRYYPGGPYEDEDARVYDYSTGVPSFVAGLDGSAGPAQRGVPSLVV